jgi:hypothetical protein
MPIAKHHAFTEPSQDKQADLLRRAVAAWRESLGDAPAAPALGQGSGFKMHKGLGYVVLLGTESAHALAVYRVRSDNLMLRRMKRWPARVAPRG